MTASNTFFMLIMWYICTHNGGYDLTASILFFSFFQWLPESARYHVACGNQEKAHAILKQVALCNNKPMPLGKLKIEENLVSSKWTIFKCVITFPLVLFHVPIYTSCLFVSCHFAFEKDLAKIEAQAPYQLISSKWVGTR